MKKWSPRFSLYARAQGRKPQAQLDHDREKYPGGCMAGFFSWMTLRINRFAAKHPEHCFIVDPRTPGLAPVIHNQDAFTRWLEAHV